MKPVIYACIAFLLTSSVATQASAQKLESFFAPPRLVMKHQKELQLTDKQKQELKTAIKATQSKSTDLEFEMQEEAETLRELVAKPKVDQKAALSQANKVMALEARLKATRLELLIITKNTLTSAQWQKVEKYRAEQKKRRKAKKAKRQKNKQNKQNKF